MGSWVQREKRRRLIEIRIRKRMLKEEEGKRFKRLEQRQREKRRRLTESWRRREMLERRQGGEERDKERGGAV